MHNFRFRSSNGAAWNHTHQHLWGGICGIGTRQSPIDIPTGKTAKIHESALMWKNNATLFGDGKKHRFLERMHFGTKPGHFETSKIHFPLAQYLRLYSGLFQTTVGWSVRMHFCLFVRLSVPVNIFLLTPSFHFVLPYQIDF